MKRKITLRYLIVFTVSVLLIIVLWVGLSYMVVFVDNKVDQGSPQYLSNTFGMYVDQNDFVITNRGKKVLKDNNLWAQIIDCEGNVIDAFNAPAMAQSHYDVFELSYYVLYSGSMENQTVYLSKFKKIKNYGVIIGCESSRIEKYNIQFLGGIREQLVKSGLILTVIFILIGIIAGFVFSRTISSPIQDIISDINNLEANIHLEDKEDYKKNLFSSVYASLDKLQSRLKSADRERANVESQKNEWIRNVSHDMRTPLSSIKGYAEIMIENKYEISAEERKYYSDIIIKNSDTIDRLIQELKYNRLSETGILQLNKEEVNINMLIKECCAELPAEYSSEKVSMDFECDILYANIDKNMFKRCFSNLICNAFVHNNGAVNINIKSFKEGEQVVIKFSDDGKGLPEEELDKIFERYYRGTSSKNSVGSGLGLAIVKEIVEAHGGNISAQSKEEKGITFTMKL